MLRLSLATIVLAMVMGCAPEPVAVTLQASQGGLTAPFPNGTNQSYEILSVDGTVVESGWFGADEVKLKLSPGSYMVRSASHPFAGTIPIVRQPGENLIPQPSSGPRQGVIGSGRVGLATIRCELPIWIGSSAVSLLVTVLPQGCAVRLVQA